MSWFHRHHWKTLEHWTVDLVIVDSGTVYGHKYITRQQCTECGKEVVRIKESTA